MNIALSVAKMSQPTGEILAGLLTDSGLRLTDMGNAEAVVCYGVPYKGQLPALNAKAGTFDNLSQIKQLGEKGVRVPPFVVDIENADWNRVEFPMLAREEKHHGGKDIRPVMQVEEVPWRVASGSKFFTQYIPIAEEYRVWIYRRRVQAVYTKQMQYPDKYKRIGRNWQNGFAFAFVPKENRYGEATVLAAKAVFALGLDFGAVDIIQGKDGRFYVLECNTAPGVSEGIRQGITSLSSSIVKWAKNGFKKQNEKFADVGGEER